MASRTLATLAAAATLLLVGCGDSDPGGSSSDDSDGASAETAEAVALMDEGPIKDLTGETEVTVDSRDNVFQPKYIEVSKGTTVVFDNVGRNVHNVLPVQEGAFEPIEADEFDPGDTGTVTFDEAGDFPYYCSLHGTKTKGMIGGVRVVDDGAAG